MEDGEELQRKQRIEAWERNRGADLKDFICRMLLKRVVSDTWKKETKKGIISD